MTIKKNLGHYYVISKDAALAPDTSWAVHLVASKPAGSTILDVVQILESSLLPIPGKSATPVWLTEMLARTRLATKTIHEAAAAMGQLRHLFDEPEEKP